MKRLLCLICLASIVIVVHAQRITHSYNNVSLADALRQLSEQQTGYTIMFLYNELEDFHVTTTIKRKTLPAAATREVMPDKMNETDYKLSL